MAGARKPRTPPSASAKVARDAGPRRRRARWRAACSSASSATARTRGARWRRRSIARGRCRPRIGRSPPSWSTASSAGACGSIARSTPSPRLERPPRSRRPDRAANGRLPDPVPRSHSRLRRRRTTRSRRARAPADAAWPGFANALLRRLARSGEPPLPDAAGDPTGYLEAAIGFPAWLARLTLAELPAADAIAFGEAAMAPAPITLARQRRARLTRGAPRAARRGAPGRRVRAVGDRSRRDPRPPVRRSRGDRRLRRRSLRGAGRRGAGGRRALRRRGR